MLNNRGALNCFIEEPLTKHSWIRIGTGDVEKAEQRRHRFKNLHPSKAEFFRLVLARLEDILKKRTSVQCMIEVRMRKVGNIRAFQTYRTPTTVAD
jgi:hypothetical protein